MSHLAHAFADHGHLLQRENGLVVRVPPGAPAPTAISDGGRGRLERHRIVHHGFRAAGGRRDRTSGSNGGVCGGDMRGPLMMMMVMCVIGRGDLTAAFQTFELVSQVVGDFARGQGALTEEGRRGRGGGGRRHGRGRRREARGRRRTHRIQQIAAEKEKIY